MASMNKRPIAITVACIGIAALLVWSQMKTMMLLASSSNPPVNPRLFFVMSVLVGLGCVVAVWFRVGWIRWVLVALFITAPLLDAYAMSQIARSTPFSELIAGQLAHNWNYWLPLLFLILLFLPGSMNWFGGSKDVAT